MEFDVSILNLQRLLKGIDYNDIEKGANALTSIFSKFPEKTSTLIYYMALSIDRNLLNNFMNDSTLGSLMSNAIVINQDWFIKTICHLHFQDYIYEIIAYGPSGISTMLLPNLIQLMEGKLLSLEGNVQKILSASFNKILYLVTSQKYNISSLIECYAVKLTHFISFYIVNVLESPITTMEINSCGKLVFEFLIVLENCISLVYTIESMDENKFQFYHVDNEYVHNDDHTLGKFHTLPSIIDFLLEHLEKIIKVISCDVWITWEEFPLENSSIQGIIGNKIYLINEELKKQNHDISNTLKQCLTHFQIKPITEDEEITNASLTEIVDKISSNSCNNVRKWYAALINTKDVWKSSSSINFLLSHIDYTSVPEEVLIKSLDFIIETPNEKELINKFLRVCKSLNIFSQNTVLLEICSRQSIDVFYDEDCEENIIITFNKFSSNTNYNELMEELIVLFLKRPLKVIMLVFKFAVTSNENHNMCIYVIDQLKCAWKINLGVETTSNCMDECPFLTLSLEKLFRKCFQEKEAFNLACFFNILTSEHSENFPVLALIDIIVNMIDENLYAENLVKSKFLMTLLKSISFDSVEQNNKVLLLAFMSQVASKTSWDVESFSKEKVETNKICYDVITELIHTTTYADSKWLMNILNDVDEITKTYFCNVWLNNNLKFPGEKKLYMKLLLAIRSDSTFLINLEESVSMENQKNTTAQLCFHHLKIIPIIHKNEWFPLFINCVTLLEKVKIESPYSAAFEIFSSSMTMLGIACDSSTYSCFEFCMGNFSHLFNLILPDVPNQDFIIVFNNAVKPLKQILCPIVKNNCFYLVFPILLKSVQNFLDTNYEIYDDNSLLPFVIELEENWRTDFIASFNFKPST